MLVFFHYFSFLTFSGTNFPNLPKTFYIFLHFISSYPILFLFLDNSILTKVVYFQEWKCFRFFQLSLSLSLILRCREHLEFRVVLAQSDWFLNSVLPLLYPPGCFSDNRTDMLRTELQLKCLL